MSRHTRGLIQAVKAATYSDLYSYKVGAALFRGSKLIALGWNSKKSHPRNISKAGFSQHAEFYVFTGLHKHSIQGCDLYIARITKKGKVSIAKPCVDCQNYLMTLGLHRVFYTDRQGDLCRLDFNEPAYLTPYHLEAS